MARAGVMYSHVAKAAAQLTAAGKTPTVDTVREAMGGTGSKSTIAPMLKQWKAQHEGEVAAAGAGLPADLLEAVQGVYERVQEGAEAQVAQLCAEHQLATQEAARAVEALRAEGRQLGAECEALAGELTSVKATLARELAARQKDAVAIAALEAEKDGQTQRLRNRARGRRQREEVPRLRRARPPSDRWMSALPCLQLRRHLWMRFPDRNKVRFHPLLTARPRAGPGRASTGLAARQAASCAAALDFRARK